MANWIKKAVPKSHRGLFAKKAAAAGKSTSEYAREKSSASGTLGKEARFAETMAGIAKKKHRSKLYSHKD